MAVAFALATVAGLYLVSVAGWPIVAIGVLSILSGIGYTAGPAPLAYIGAADVFVIVFFGFVAVAGTTYVQTLSLEPLALVAAVRSGRSPPRFSPSTIFATATRTSKPTSELCGSVWPWIRSVGISKLDRARVHRAVALVATESSRPRWSFAASYAAVGHPAGAAGRPARGRDLNANLAGTARLLLVFSVLFAGGLLM